MKPLPNYDDTAGWRNEARAIFPELDIEVLNAKKDLHSQIDEIIYRRLGLKISSADDWERIPAPLKSQLHRVCVGSVMQGNFSMPIDFDGKRIHLIHAHMPTQMDRKFLPRSLGIESTEFLPHVKDMLNYSLIAHETAHSGIIEYFKIENMEHATNNQRRAKVAEKFSEQFGVALSEADHGLLQERIVIPFSCILTDRRLKLPAGTAAEVFSDFFFLKTGKDSLMYDATTVLDHFHSLSKNVKGLTEPMDILDACMQHAASNWTSSIATESLFDDPLVAWIYKETDIFEKAVAANRVLTKSTSLLSRSYTERWLMGIKRMAKHTVSNSPEDVASSLPSRTVEALQFRKLLDPCNLK